MKLNERNIDDWLHKNLQNASSQPESDLLEDILQKNKGRSGRRKGLLWLNIVFITLGLGHFAYWLSNNHKTENSFDQNPNIVTSPNTNKHTTKIELKHSDPPIEENIKLKNTEPVYFKTKTDLAQINITKTNPVQKPANLDYVPYFDISGKQINPFLPISISDAEVVKMPLADSALSSKIDKLNHPLALKDTSTKKKFLLAKQLIQAFSKPIISYEINAGYNYNQTKIIGNNPDPKHTHKNYQKVISEAFNGNNGFDISAGFKFGYTKFSLIGALTYSHSEQVLKFNTPNWEAPVIDQNGEIRGYIELDDSLKKIETSNTTLIQNEVSIPLSFSLKQNLTPNFTVEFGIGVLPKLKTFAKLNLPGTADMLTSSASRIKPNFSSPATIRLGFYKKLPQFTIGLSGIFTPFYSSQINLPGQLVLQSRQTNIQLSFIKQL